MPDAGDKLVRKVGVGMNGCIAMCKIIYNYVSHCWSQICRVLWNTCRTCMHTYMIYIRGKGWCWNDRMYRILLSMWVRCTHGHT